MSETEGDVLDAVRWGLPTEAVDCLAERLSSTWERFRPCFKTRTRDASTHAWVYLRGLLTMDNDRTFTNIARRVVDPTNDGQGLQQFMSDSPWSARAVIGQVQAELKATPALALSTEGVLILDESADEKAGGKSAGAGRQHNGRLGIIDMCQVGTFLAFATESVWTWVDGELFLPQEWFNPGNVQMQQRRQQLGIPSDREFATKVQLGWRMIERVSGLPKVVYPWRQCYVMICTDVVLGCVVSSMRLDYCTWLMYLPPFTSILPNQKWDCHHQSWCVTDLLLRICEW